MQEPMEVAAKEEEKVLTSGEEKKAEGENQVDAGVTQDGKKKEEEKKNNEMILDKYEKILEQKRKALATSKVEESKVEADKAFETMQMVDKKSTEEDVFIKLGADKDKKKKEK